MIVPDSRNDIRFFDNPLVTGSPNVISGEKGTGIGLATVKSLVEGLGGTIHLITENGKGANFEFTLRK